MLRVAPWRGFSKASEVPGPAGNRRIFREIRILPEWSIAAGMPVRRYCRQKSTGGKLFRARTRKVDGTGEKLLASRRHKLRSERERSGRIKSLKNILRGGKVMNATCKTLLKATVAVSSLCIASQAYAAEQPDEEVVTISRNDIIVSARRVEERLQDVPISVAVVNQEQLSKANISSADELVKFVPGLNVESRYSSETNAFAIRGFNQALRTSSAVGTYFAEVVAPRGGAGAFPGGDGAGPGHLFDLQNVQVLKGPQGTLFGRNTTGGAVMLTPVKPTRDFEGYIEGSVGNYSMRRVQGVVNLPLGDSVRVRLGADHQTRDGTLNNVSGIGPARLNDIDYIALRGSLVIDLTPDLENYTIVSYLNSDHIGTQPQIYRGNTFTTFGNFAQGQIARLAASGDPYQVETTLSNPRSITKQFQAINITTWQASDNLTLKNIFSYATFRQGLRQSVFGTNFQLPLATFGVPVYLSTAQAFNVDGFWGNNQNTLVEEFQIQYRSGDGRFNGQTGIYYEHSTPGAPSNSSSISVGAQCMVGPYTSLDTMRCRGGTVNYNFTTMEFESLAGYAQGTYAVTDQLKLTAGVRVTWDRSEGTNQAFVAPFVPATGSAFGPAVLGTPPVCPVTHAAYTNCLVPGSELNTSTTRPTWTLSASYNPTEDVMVYGSYSRGYRQGATAPQAVGGKTSFDPEKVDSYELGVKTTWHGRMPGHFNLTGFYSNITDAQVLVGLSCTRTEAEGGCPLGGSATSVFNAGKARMYGAEFDGMLRISDEFRINAAGAWVNTKITEFDADITAFLPNFNTALNTGTVGDPLPLTPEFSVNVGATITLPIREEMGRLELSALYRYASSFATAASDTNTAAAARLIANAPGVLAAAQAAFDAGNITQAQLNQAIATFNSTPANAAGIAATPVDKGTAVSQLDLNLDWSNVGGLPVDLGLFANNVTDQVTYTLIQPLFSSFGFDLRYLGQPRTFGGRLRFRF
jgi:iron complex outermembrane receptor protein